jgi:hypothetical protein
MPINAQPHNPEGAAPRTKYDMLVLVIVMLAISTIAGFLTANYF